jgi:hypothetical protein
MRRSRRKGTGRRAKGKGAELSAPRIVLFAFALCLLPFALVAPAAGADWSVLTDARVSYTDDVFQFSAARRQRFIEDPSQPTVVPGAKTSDFVWEPAVEVRRLSRSAWGPTELSFKAHGFLYTNNPIFNHGNYRIQVRQALGPETAILLRYRYTPNLFLGPNIERRTGLGLTEEERVTSHVWRVHVERQLTSALSAQLITRYGLRLYNDVFAERDTQFYTIGPQADYRVNARLSLTIGYLYEQGFADGRGDVRFNDDVSYVQHLAQVGAAIRLTDPLTLRLAYLYRRKLFTSELAGDTHRDRVDDTHQGIAELDYRLTASMTTLLAFQRTQRSSTVATRDFNDTIVTIGVQQAF